MTAMLLSGCIEEEADDYCRNHYAFHAEHVSETGRLRAELSEDGLLTVNLVLPPMVLESMQGNALINALGNPDNVYRISSASACQAATVSIEEGEDTIGAAYESQCGPDNRIEQLDVPLFDWIASLDEMVVDISTPATSKHFAISRQCDSAIFRLHDNPTDQ